MKQLSITQKRWLLSTHLLFSAILFGVTVVYLVFCITAATTNNQNVLESSYRMMHVLTGTSGRVSIYGTVVTGILLSVFTKWGLFKYKWIIVKEILTIFSIGIGIFGVYYWSLNAFTIVSSVGMDGMQNQTFIKNNIQLYIGIVLQIIFLATMMIISVFKPWGRRKSSNI
jgi:hypothetical protein